MKTVTVSDAAIARDRAARIASLWQKPVLTDTEVAEAVGLAHSSWQQLRARGDCPKVFNIGRRVFARTADVRQWLDAKAAA